MYHSNQDVFESERGTINNYTRVTGVNLDCAEKSSIYHHAGVKVLMGKIQVVSIV
jgi:hypothetical protein